MEQKKKASVNFKLMRPKAASSSIVLIVQAGFNTNSSIGKPIMTEYNYDKQNRLTDEKIHRYYPEKFKYIQIQMATGLTIPPPFWQQKEQLCIGNYSHYNDNLKAIEKTVYLIYDSLLKSQGNITSEHLKKEIQKRIKRKDEKGLMRIPKIKDDSNQFFTDYIQAKIDKHRAMGKRKDKTLTDYKKFLTKVIKFEEDVLNSEKITMQDINTNLLEDAILWFKTLKNPQTKKLYSLNYLGWFIKNWKRFINYAKGQDDMIFKDLNLNKEFLNKEGEAANDIYLTFDQLKAIKAIKFDEEEKQLEEIRDSFIIQCSHGQRWGDHIFIHKIFQNEKGKYYFFVSRTEKNKTVNVKIPIMDNDVIKIYKKYNNSLPLIRKVDKQKAKKRSNGAEQMIIMADQRYNDYLKIIGMRAKLNDLHYQTQTDSMGKSVHLKPEPIYNMISSKVGRKTAISNWIREYNIPLPIAMEWSNHQSEESFRIYVKLSKEDYYKMANKALEKLKYL
jgi:hypothetical protein